MGKDIIQQRQLQELIKEQKRTNQLLEQVLIALNKPDMSAEQKGRYVDAQLSGYLGRKAETYGGGVGPDSGVS